MSQHLQLHHQAHSPIVLPGEDDVQAAQAHEEVSSNVAGRERGRAFVLVRAFRLIERQHNLNFLMNSSFAFGI